MNKNFVIALASLSGAVISVSAQAQVIQETGPYNAPGGFNCRFQSAQHCGNNPKSWIRGSASLNKGSRVLNVQVQSETASVTAGPKGKVPVPPIVTQGGLSPIVRNGDPVAVVYSRCELENGLCKARDGLYYVHNGVAREDLHADAVNHNGKGAQISHVADWSTGVEAVHICSADEAAKATETSKNGCEGNKGSGDKWRAWVLVKINPYSSSTTKIQDPIFIVWYNTISKITHDGVFESFDGKKTIPSGTTEKGILAYWHFKNPYTTGEERISKDPNHFKLGRGSETSIFEIKKIK